jgi:hypothetical protein
MNNSAEIFAIALGLSEPWFVKNVEFKMVDSTRELHIDLDFKKGFKHSESNKKVVQKPNCLLNRLNFSNFHC